MKHTKRYLSVFLALGMIMFSTFTLRTNAATVEEHDTVADTTENHENELQPLAANTCYDYSTVDDCMKDISKQYDFTYSKDGTGYICSGNYSVVINNSHNYLNVILSYNGTCIQMYTCGMR